MTSPTSRNGFAAPMLRNWRTPSDTGEGSSGGASASPAYAYRRQSASIGMIVFLVLQDVYETPVGVAFIGGLAVEVVGVAVVIAKYLFPDGGATSNRLLAPSVSEEDDA